MHNNTTYNQIETLKHVKLAKLTGYLSPGLQEDLEYLSKVSRSRQLISVFQLTAQPR